MLRCRVEEVRYSCRRALEHEPIVMCADDHGVSLSLLTMVQLYRVSYVLSSHPSAICISICAVFVVT